MFSIYRSLPGTRSSPRPTSQAVLGEQLQPHPAARNLQQAQWNPRTPEGLHGIPEGSYSRTDLSGFIC